jgi:hypothetical protein
MRRYWSRLPEDFKQYISGMQKKEGLIKKEGFMIRTKAINLVLGRERFSLSEIEIDPTTGEELFKSHNLKRIIRIVEKFWTEIVNMNKVGIVIKTPMVLIENVVSNSIQVMQAGGSLPDMFKYNIIGFRFAREHIKLTQEIRELQVKRKYSKDKAKIDLKIKVLEKKRRSNPLHYMYEEGFNQSIVSDIDVKKYQYNVPEMDSKLAGVGSTIRKLSHYDKLKGKPKTAIDFAFMTQDSPFFKLMVEVTQYSDFVSRFALDQIAKENSDKIYEHKWKLWYKENAHIVENYEERKERFIQEEKAKDEANRIWKLSNAHIDYGLLDNKYLDYMNRIGLVMFTKYLFGIQRMILSMAKEHPVTVLSILAMQLLLGWDPDDPFDSNIIQKSPLTRFMHGPIDHLKGAVTPYGLKLIYDVVSSSGVSVSSR